MSPSPRSAQRKPRQWLRGGAIRNAARLALPGLVGAGGLVIAVLVPPTPVLWAALMMVFGLAVGLATLHWVRAQHARTGELHARLDQQIAIAQQAERELARVNRALQAISAGNRVIAGPGDEPAMLQQVCETIVASGYQLAWVSFAEYGAANSLTPVAGAPPALVAELAQGWAGDDPRQGPARQALRDGAPISVAGIALDPAHRPGAAAGAHAEPRALLAIPLYERAEAVGVLCLCSDERDAFAASEVALLAQLGRDLALGLAAHRAQVARQAIARTLRAEQTFAQLVTATSPVGIMVVDRRGQVTFANPHAEQLLGIDRTALLWRGATVLEDAEDLPDTLAEGAHTWAHRFAVALEQGQPIHAQRRSIMCQDGTRRALLINGAPLPDAEGRPSAMVLTLSDITAQIMLEAALATAQGELEQRVVERTADLATANERLAHELAERRQIEGQLAEREHFVKRLSDALPSILILYDLTSASYLYTNRAISAILGYSIAEFTRLSGVFLEQLVHPDDWQAHQQHLAQLRAAHDSEPLRLECRVRHQDGSWRWLALRTVVFQRDADGATARILGTARDSTAQHQAEQALYKSNQQLQASLATMERQTTELNLLSELSELLQLCITLDEMVTVLARGLPRLFATASGAVALREAADAGFSRTVRWGPAPPPASCQPGDCWAVRYGQIYASDGRPLAPSCRHAATSAGQATVCMPIQVRDEVYGVLMLNVTSLTADDQSQGWLRAEQERLVITLTSQLALSLANLQLRASLQQLATHDPLTGLLNRRALDEALLRELRRARRGGRPCGLIMLDIDHFKRVNDTDGHGVGDLILQLIARQLAGHIRAEDIAYRYGGEEFVVLLPEASLEETVRRAEELRGAIEQLAITQTGATVGGVTISLGVAAFPDHGESGPVLLAAADAALYAAKRGGRNRVASASGVASP
jgi:diguanylate cyclase (GGDEF)-like protein/PAS domain S-box-containing protein